jgi:hypothetical protein
MAKLKASDLTPEQLDAIDRLYEYDETLLIAGVGFGKAIVGLTALQNLINDGVVNRALVIAPLRVANLTWGTEPARWEHVTTPVAIATGSPAQRLKALESGAPIVVVNLENVRWMLKTAGDQFDALLVDEISKLKAAGGTGVKALRKWTPGLTWRTGMSATPVAECAEDIYAQALLLDGGRALGSRKDIFLNRYFTPTDYNQYSWELRPGAAEQISDALAELVFIADDAGYRDGLPTLHAHMVPVTPPADLVDVYRDMETHGVVKTPTAKVLAPNAAVRSGKLFQIAAGGLYAEDKSLAWRNDFKLTALQQLLATLPDEPTIVCYQFTFELDALQQAYPDAPVLGRGHKFTETMLEQWNRGEYPVLILHHRSAAHGLNLQRACRRLVHLSPIWGADPWAQTVGRIRRRGQTRDVHRYVLLTENTVDLEILDRQDLKRDEEIEMMTALDAA